MVVAMAGLRFGSARLYVGVCRRVWCYDIRLDGGVDDACDACSWFGCRGNAVRNFLGCEHHFEAKSVRERNERGDLEIRASAERLGECLP